MVHAYGLVAAVVTMATTNNVSSSVTAHAASVRSNGVRRPIFISIAFPILALIEALRWLL